MSVYILSDIYKDKICIYYIYVYIDICQHMFFYKKSNI